MLALAFIAVLFFARVLMLAGRDLDWSFGLILALSWQDCAIAGGFCLLTLASRKLPRRAQTLGLLLFCALVLHSALNVVVVRVLGTPITPALLNAAGGALSDSISHYLTAANIATILSIVTAAFLPLFLARRWEKFISPRALIIGSSALFVAAGIGRQLAPRFETHGLERNALVSTFSKPRLPSEHSSSDWTVSLVPANEREDLEALRGIAAGRNVILIALESTGAHHLKPWGGPDDLMPTLTSLAADAILFENAYAVYPESIKGLYSTLCSAYPAVHARAGDYECLGPTSLPLQLRGYPSALMHSGRFDYLGMEEILRHRGFNQMLDAADLSTARESSFGVDDEVTVDAMLRWLDQRPVEKPFLLTYLPVAGHHPYITPGNDSSSGGSDLIRYRRALTYSDRMLARFIDGLKQRGLYESSLFVIYGDHSEAFNEHEGNIGHTLHLYEENLRVPLLIVAPGAIRGERRVTRPVSLVDVAPTITDLLGAVPAPDWQGRSLLHPAPRPSMFLTDYSLPLLGLRDGRWKFIYDLESERAKLYDLENDPAERVNVAAQHPDLVARFRAAVLSWSAEQRARYKAMRRSDKT